MARHGRCRCGTVLVFRLRPWGYKRRCPQCGAVVRLRERRSVPATPPRPGPPPAHPATVPMMEVQLWPVEEYAPRPARWYWLWIGLAAGLALVGILTLIWYTRR